MEAARRDFVPASNWGVAQAAAPFAGGPQGWQSVGGLEDVVLALKEAIEIPMKHPRLIAKYASVSLPLSISKRNVHGYGCQ